MKRRTIFLILSLPALLLVSGLAVWTWLMNTEHGLHWLIERLDAAVAGRVSVSQARGDLADGISLSGVVYEDSSTRISIEKLTLAVDVDLFPPGIGLLSPSLERVTLQSLGQPEGDLDISTTLSGLSMPVPIGVESLRITEFELLDADGTPENRIDALELTGSLSRTLVIERGSLVSSPHRLAISGQVGLSAPHRLQLALEAGGEFSARASVRGSLDSADLRFESDEPRLTIEGTVADVTGTPSWELSAASPLLEWPGDDQSIALTVEDFSAQSRGELSGYRLSLGGRIQTDALQALSLDLEASGNREELTIEQVTASGEELSLTAAGFATWKEQAAVEADIELERLDPVHWLEDWPEGRLLSGRLQVGWSDRRVDISRFTLGVPDSRLTVEGEGIVDLESGVVDVELAWQELSWPPGSEKPDLFSPTGRFTVSGKPEDWNLAGGLELHAADLPPGEVEIKGSGTRESFTARILDGSVLGGAVSGDVTLDWSGPKPFTLSLTADSLGIAPLAPEYPGVLSGRVHADGQLEPFSLNLAIEDLDGTVRSVPFSGGGSIALGPGRLAFSAFELRSGPSLLRLDGDPYTRQGLGFVADIRSLSLFSDGLAGRLDGAGSLSIDSVTPRLSARLTGEDLVFGDVRIARLEWKDSDLDDGGSVLTLTGLDTGQQVFESIQIRSLDPQPLRKMSVLARTESARAELLFEGSIVDWSDFAGSGWKGGVSVVRLDYAEKLSLVLDEPASLEIRAGDFTLGRACFSGSRDSKLCAESSWRAPGDFELSAELGRIPLELLDLYFDSELEFTQILSGNIDYSSTQSGSARGGARIDISPGVIRLEDEDELALRTGTGLFGFKLDNGQLKQGDMDITLPGSGNINIDFSVPELDKGGESAVTGRALVDVEDIGVIGSIFPVFDSTSGVLDIDLSLSGTLEDPAFSGRATLAGGHLEHQASGLSFTDINLAGNVNERDRSELHGTFRAGEGSGQLTALIEFGDILSPVVRLQLTGESLTAIDVPDLKVIADADVTLGWRDDMLNIDGRLAVPVARLSPQHLPQSSMPESEDVVIVAGSLPDRQSDRSRDRPFGLFGNLEVELGEQVIVDLDLARASVTGSTVFNWQGGLVPLAEGGFNVTGEIQAYGQLLQVTRGRIGFPGIPADNPHLNIRAEREIYGNSQIRRAGLMVAGTLRRPVIEAYTVPMTNRERAQTLLVTGSDFNFEKGVGAVDVGTYILPRLYISYGIGVFEDGNVIRARYDLGRGWGVKATSGERETGFDINYRIER